MLRAGLLLAGPFAFFLIAPGFAQPCGTPPGTSPLAPGEIGLFLDPEGTRSCTPPPPFTQAIPAYLVASLPEGGLDVFDLPSVEIVSPLGTHVSWGEVLPAGYGAVGGADFCPPGAAVTAGSCPAGTNPMILALARYVVFYLGGDSICISRLCYNAHLPYPHSLHYLPCGARQGRDAVTALFESGTSFVRGSYECVRLRSSTPVEGPTWGGVKVLYGRQ